MIFFYLINSFFSSFVTYNETNQIEGFIFFHNHWCRRSKKLKKIINKEINQITNITIHVVDVTLYDLPSDLKKEFTENEFDIDNEMIPQFIYYNKTNNNLKRFNSKHEINNVIQFIKFTYFDGIISLSGYNSSVIIDNDYFLLNYNSKEIQKISEIVKNNIKKYQNKNENIIVYTNITKNKEKGQLSFFKGQQLFDLMILDSEKLIEKFVEKNLITQKKKILYTINEQFINDVFIPKNNFFILFRNIFDKETYLEKEIKENFLKIQNELLRDVYFVVGDIVTPIEFKLASLLNIISGNIKLPVALLVIQSESIQIKTFLFSLSKKESIITFINNCFQNNIPNSILLSESELNQNDKSDIIEFTNNNFQYYINKLSKSNKIIVLYLYQETCIYCLQFKYIYKSLAEYFLINNHESVVFSQYNTNKINLAPIEELYNIKQFPTILFYLDNSYVRYTKSFNYQSLKEYLIYLLENKEKLNNNEEL